MKIQLQKILVLLTIGAIGAIFNLTPVLHSQPPVEFVRTYDLGRAEMLNDIFACSNGDFIACAGGDEVLQGYHSDFWLLRVDEDGDEVWSSTYEDNDVSGMGFSVIETGMVISLPLEL